MCDALSEKFRGKWGFVPKAIILRRVAKYRKIGLETVEKVDWEKRNQRETR